jgi:TctA family transporter
MCDAFLQGLLHDTDPLALGFLVLGVCIGILPAIGGPAATFVAYGMAKQSSKHPGQARERSDK